MNKIIHIFTVLFLFFCITIQGATIKVLKTRLLTKNDFLSQTIITLKRGYKVKIIKSKGSWYIVNYKGKKGYIHKTTIGKINTKLSVKKTIGRNASNKEIALAAKGFSETNERKIRGRKNLYNFNALKWIMKHKTSIKQVKNFKKKGDLK